MQSKVLVEYEACPHCGRFEVSLPVTDMWRYIRIMDNGKERFYQGSMDRKLWILIYRSSEGTAK